MSAGVSSKSSALLAPTDPPGGLYSEQQQMIENQTLPIIYAVKLDPQKVFAAMLDLWPRKTEIRSVLSVPDVPDTIFVETVSNEIGKLFDGIEVKSIERVSDDSFIDVICNKLRLAHLSPGKAVRMSRSDYPNDPAQVVDVASNRLIIKLLPRIDYDGMQSNGVSSQKKLSSMMPRDYQPAISGFDAERIKQLGGVVESARMHVSFAENKEVEVLKWDGNLFIGKFMYLDVSVSVLCTGKPLLSRAEVEQFQAGMAPFERANEVFVRNANSLQPRSNAERESPASPAKKVHPRALPAVTPPIVDEFKPGDVAMIKTSKFRGLIVEIDNVEGGEATYHPLQCQMFGHITHFKKSGESGVNLIETCSQASLMIPNFRVGDLIETEEGTVFCVYRCDLSNNALELVSMENKWLRVNLGLNTRFKPVRLLADDNSCIDHQGNRVCLNDSIVTKDGAYGRVGRTWKKRVVCVMDDGNLLVYPDAHVKVRGLPPATRPTSNPMPTHDAAPTTKTVAPPVKEPPVKKPPPKWARPGVVVNIQRVGQGVIVSVPRYPIVSVKLLLEGKPSDRKHECDISELSPVPVEENDRVLAITDTREYTGTVKWKRGSTVNIQVDKSKVVRDTEISNVFKFNLDLH